MNRLFFVIAVSAMMACYSDDPTVASSVSAASAGGSTGVDDLIANGTPRVPLGSENQVGAGGSTEDCPAPDGWQSVTTCDDPGLVLGTEVNEAACGPCSCGDWAGECALGFDAVLQCWPASQGSCPGTPPWESASAESCQSGPPAGEFHNCKLEQEAPAVGGCEATGGEPIESPPWRTTVGLCDGCGCFAREGEHDCPELGMTRTVGYEDADDERSCSACSCSDPETCASEAVVSNNCDGQIATVDTACVGVNYQGSWVYAVEATTPSSCASSGGEPSGAVVPTGAWTVCCAL